MKRLINSIKSLISSYIELQRVTIFSKFIFIWFKEDIDSCIKSGVDVGYQKGYKDGINFTVDQYKKYRNENPLH